MTQMNLKTLKFNFFQIIKDSEFLNKNNEISTEKNKEKIDTLNINLSDISPNQMYAIEGVIFICGEAIRKNEEKLIREKLVIKVVNNKIMDKYEIYNRLFYDFQIKEFNNKIYFICIGGDLETYNLNEELKEKKDNTINKIFMTSIKIYDATSFVKLPLPLRKTDNTKNPIDKYLLKNIKLLRDENTGEIYSEKEKLSGLESFQNISSFAINSDFSQCAIGIEKGQIILILGKPNLLSCSLKDIKIRKLKQNNNEIPITNLAFHNILNNEILYVSNTKTIFYYIIDNNTFNDKITNLNIYDIEGGAYSGCIDVKNNKLIVFSNIKNTILEYENLKRLNSWYSEGKKHCIKYFQNYIIYVTLESRINTLEIFDPYNSCFFYYNKFPRIYAICCDQEFVYAFIDDEEHRKCIIKLKEKDNKDKFEILFQNNLYDFAYKFAINLNYDNEQLSEISQKFGEHCYSRGEYNKSIEQYIKTINYLEPSNIIQKFLEKSKLDYLILYLEALELNEIFQKRDPEELKDYTTLLLNCYIMQEKFDKLKEFIEKNKKLPEKIIKKAINVCLETEKIDLALQIAKQNNLIEDVLRILIEKQGKYIKALDYIQPDKNDKINKSQVQVIDRINLFCKFSQLFLENEEMKEKFYSRVEQFIDEFHFKFNYEDMVKLVQIFFGYDKYFKLLFDKLENYSGIYNKIDQSLIHKRIELYLEDEDISQRNKILNMLQSERYKNVYNKTYLLMLFKEKEFSEGEIALLKNNIDKNKNELLSIYMDKRSYEEIINFCTNNSDKIYLDLALNYFSSPENRIPKEGENEEELNKQMNIYLQKLLDNIIENKSIIPVHALDILKESNPKISMNLIKNFMKKSFKKEEEPLEKNKILINELNEELKKTKKEINDLKTKNCTLISGNCPECGLKISLPAIFFLCHHTYHSLCLISSNYDENPECRKCLEKKNKLVNNMIKEREIIYDKNKFNSEIQNKGIYSFYGKGIMGFKDLKNENYVINREENIEEKNKKK